MCKRFRISLYSDATKIFAQPTNPDFIVNTKWKVVLSLVSRTTLMDVYILSRPYESRSHDVESIKLI